MVSALDTGGAMSIDRRRGPYILGCILFAATMLVRAQNVLLAWPWMVASWRRLRSGNRRDDLERMYLRSELALRYDAGVETDTTDAPSRGSWRVERPQHWDELPWSKSM